MSFRQVIWAWLIAGGLLLVSIVASRVIGAEAPPAFHHAAIAVIGSSQSRYAVPRTGVGGTSIGNNGELFWRFGVSAISEPETVDLANRALDEKARFIIVEMNALIFDNDQTAARGRCNQPARHLLIVLKDVQLNITSSWIHFLTRDGRFDDGGEPANLSVSGSIDPAKGRHQIPSHLRGPCDMAALVRLAQRARRQGSRLILMAPPRSATADRLLGIDRRHAIDRAEDLLAKDLGVPLFAPASPYPDSFFFSIGHLDQAGRARFVSELHDFLRRE